MTEDVWTIFFFLVTIGVVAYFAYKENQTRIDRLHGWRRRQPPRLDGETPEERAAYEAQKQKVAAQNTARMAHGPLNSAMICPHCQQQGGVRTKKIDRKRGISGGKATAALLTGGVSMLATGLSRKEHITRARCTKCGNGWDF